MRGASALAAVLQTKPDPRLKVLVVWERVIATDFGTPSGAILAEISDRRVVQFWDPSRTLSKSMGETRGDDDSIVWDWVALYAPGARWENAAPEPLFQGRTVESVARRLSEKLGEVLAAK